MTNRFVITEVSGLHAQTKFSLALLPSGDQYIACVGSGVALFPLNNRVGPKACRFFYEPPKPLKSSSSNSSPRSSPGSPTSRAGSAKIVRINKAQSVDVAFRQKLVAVGETGGYCPRLLLYNLETAECLDIVADQHEFGVPFLQFSPNGDYLVSLGTLNDGFLYVWSVKMGKLVLKYTAKCISELHDVAWLNDSQIVAVGKRIIKVWTIDWHNNGSISSRNIILGPVSDHTFECVWPTSANGNFLVGTSQGSVYQMPDGKLLVPSLAGPVKSLVIVNDLLVCSTLSHIRVYDFKELGEPLRTFGRGSPALYARGSEAFYLFTAHRSSELRSLHLTAAPSSELAVEPSGSLDSRILQCQGLQLTSTTGGSLLCWHGDYDNKIVRWPDQVIEVGISNITIADETDPDNLMVGSLSGDIWLNGKVISAHDGPISDVHVYNSQLCISCSRDRTIQVWARSSSEKDWILKQTLVIPTVVLRARLCESSDKSTMSLVCCGANKTLYFYHSTGLVSLLDDGNSVFPEPPRTQVCRGVPYDMTTYEGKVFISTNDRMISVFDPFVPDLLLNTWRPKDANNEPVNLSHICTIESQLGETYLVGSASNKCIIAYNWESGQLISCLWGFGEPIVSIATVKNKIVGAGDILLASELRSEINASSTSRNDELGVQYSDKPSGASPPRSKMQELRLSNENSFPSPEKTKVPSPGQKRVAPVRRVFQSSSTATTTSRARSLSPCRSPVQSPTKPPVTRPTLGSPTRSAIKSGTSTETLENPPPLRLSSSCRLASPSVDPTQRLISALKAFNAYDTPISSDQKDELKPLMFTALNKVDALALLEQLTAKLESRIDERLGVFQPR